MVCDHGNPRIAVVLFQDGYRFIYMYFYIVRSVKMATVTSLLVCTDKPDCRYYTCTRWMFT